MTREEFLKQRAIQHFERTIGVTKLPAQPIPDQPVFSGRRRTSGVLTNAMHRMTGHCVDTDTGDATPVQSQRIRNA
jgi:hypothetical protein